MATATKTKTPRKQDSLENLDRIRSIILGSTMREYDRRLRKVEQAIEKLGAAARESVAELKAELDKTREKLQQDMTALERRIGERVQAIDKKSSEQNAAMGKKLEAEREKVTQRMDETKTKLGAKITKQAEKLTETTSAMYDELAALIEEAADETRRQLQAVDRAKANRFVLGDMMIALGSSLKNGSKAARSRKK